MKLNTTKALRLYYFSCRVCGYNSEQAHLLTLRTAGLCPMCLDDIGVHNELAFRPATPDETKGKKLGLVAK